MKILNVTSEANPFAKTGGLADVVYALSKELTVLGEETSIVMPLYGIMRRSMQYPMKLVASFEVMMSWRKQAAKVYQTFVDGITFYFIDNEYYFGRDGIYGYYDDMERFAFFTIAARDMLKALNYKPDVVHVHDWQPGMLPVLVKEQNREDAFFHDMKFVLTIHNPAFQGLFDPNLLGDFYSLDYTLYQNGQVRFKSQASTLKSAIIYADAITTVSPTHAEELLTREGGKGLEAVIELRRGDFLGILNGIDYGEFDPSHDPYLPHHFDKENVREQKQKNRSALYQKLGIKDEGQPLFAIVTRLTWQKGIDLFLSGARLILENGGSVIALGNGEYTYEQDIEHLRAEYPDKMACYIGFNNQLAHEIYASADFFLMPSLFEPCGIGQMIALRYGTLPIVRLTGGLRDTVVPYNGYNEDVANGFGFENYDFYWMNLTVKYALDQYQDDKLMTKLIANAMQADNNWERSAKQYRELYVHLV